MPARKKPAEDNTAVKEDPATTPEDHSKKSLHAKLAEVMGLIDRPIAKKGKNTAQKYSFVNESDVSAAIRPLLAERGIWLWSTELSQEMSPLFLTSSKNQMWLTRVTMEFRFIDSMNGETTQPQTYSGQGADTGDKSLPKAISMCLKYFLLKTFMLSTGKDDAEADERVDKAAAASTASQGPRTRPSKQEGVQRGGKSEGVTEAQVKAIASLKKSNKLDAKDFRAFIHSTIDRVAPDEGVGSVRDWIYKLEPKEAAALIVALQALKDAMRQENVEELGTGDEHPDQTDQQGDLNIV